MLNGTTAAYGNSNETLIMITGVKSLDGISLEGTTVTIADSSLNNFEVTISTGYTLALGEDITQSKTIEAGWNLNGSTAAYKNTTTTAAGWNFSGSTATYENAATTAGYKLANNQQISYIEAGGGEKVFELTDVKNTSGVTADTSKKTVTLTSNNLNKTDVIIDGGYSLKLAKDVDTTKETISKWTTLTSSSTFYYAKVDNSKVTKAMTR